jgi:glycosyltransferase involved in cell wall biosynthesis
MGQALGLEYSLQFLLRIVGMSNIGFLCISAVFPPAYCYGGIPHSFSGLVKGLVSLGHNCLVITTNANGERNLEVECGRITAYGEIPVLYAQRWHNNRFFFAPDLGKYLRKYAPNFDIAIVNGGWGYFNLAVRMQLPHAGLPYLLYPKGLFDPWAFRHKFYKKWLYWHLLEKLNYKKAAGIVALTESEARLARQYVPEVPIQVIPNGVDLAKFQRPTGQEELGKILPALANAPYILFLSRLHPKKGLDLLFPAFQRLLKRCREEGKPQPYLVVAGDGEPEYKREIKVLAQSLEIAPQILFPGLVTGEAKQALLQHCSFMALPSRGEGLPMVVLETMASGKPVLITVGCYLSEVAAAGAGIEVELNIEQLAQAMFKLWDNPGMRLEMGEKALALVKEKFSWVKVAEQTERFCELLLAKGRRGTDGV